MNRLYLLLKLNRLESNQINNLGMGLLSFGQIFSWAGLFYVFAAFLVTWENNLLWSKAELTLGFSLAIFVSAISAPLIGKLIDNGFGKWVMLIGALVGSIALFSITIEGEDFCFILAWIIIGFAQSACLYEACFSHVLKLKPSESRRVMTHVSIIAGLAPSVAFVFGALLTSFYSWQIAIKIFSIGVAVLAAPTLFLGGLIFEYPKGDLDSVGKSQREKLNSFGVFNKPIFWLIGGSFFLIAINHGILTNHLIPILMDRGSGYSFAIITASLIGPAQIIGRLVLLKFGLGFPVSVVTLVSFAGLFSAAVFLLIADVNISLVLVFAATQGAFWGMISIVRPLMTAEFFGVNFIGAISGLIALPFLFGFSIAPYLGSLVWGVGGYNFVILLSIVSAFLSTVIAFYIVIFQRKNVIALDKDKEFN